MTRLVNTASRIARKQRRRRTNRRKCFVESLEARQLLAADVLFADSFESGGNSNDWSGNWVEDSQNDWFRSTQRATDGSRSAEVDGWANNATLTLDSPLDLSGYSSAELTFDWLIESSFDGGEYLSLDVSSNGGTSWQTDVRRLSGNVDAENTWHSETVDLTPFASSDLLVRFRSQVSGSNEDANVDNVRITGVPTSPAFPPTISYSDFSDPTGLNLIGDATIAGGNVLRLAPVTGGSGAAWYSAEKQFVSIDWETTFAFNLNENSGDFGGSDGFTFIVQNHDPSYLAGGGGTLGYHNLPNSIAIEFDTFQNSETSDPSPSHISVHTNGTGPNNWDESLSIGVYSTPELMDDAQTHNVKISYIGGTLRVFYDNFAVPVIATEVDLDEILDLDSGKAWLGFTAATGGGVQNHDILNWEFAPLQDISKTVSVDNATTVEGDSGMVSLDFTVNRAGDASGPATVDWTTQDGTATAGVDYLSASGQLFFAGGETSQSISISVIGDIDIESDESFFIELANLSDGILVDPLAVGTILTDDVSISIKDATVIEGDPGLKFFDRFVPAGYGGLTTARSAIFGPDGNLYVASKDTGEVLRYDGATGEFLGVLVEANSGLLDGPHPIIFGPDGNLYVGGQRSNNVLQYDASGNFLGEFVAAGAFGLESPRGLLFDADGHLYVTSNSDGGKVLRFQGPGGAAPGDPLPAPGRPGAEFIPAASGDLLNPVGMAIGPDGQFYVASTPTDRVNRYDAVTGDFLSTFIPPNSHGLDAPFVIKFHDGHLYVTSAVGDQVLRFDANTGAFVDTIDLANAAGLDGPVGLDFDADGILYVTSGTTNEILRYGDASTAVVEVSLSSPNADDVTVTYNTANGSDPGGADQGSDYVGRSGTLTIPAGLSSRSILVPTVADGVSEPSETFHVDLTSPMNATMVDGRGTVTVEERSFSIGDATVTEGDIAPAMQFASADNATANFNTLAFGPDGDLFVEIGGDTPLANSILRFDGSTGISEGVFISNDQFNTTRDLLFRDGILYVADLDADQVKIFDATTGASLGVFVGDDPATPGIDESGGLVGPEGLTFGPDGDLYVTGWRSDNVLRYDGQTGAYVETFATGPVRPHGIAYHDGSFFVTSQTDEVFEFNTNGDLVRTLGNYSDGLQNPIDVAIGPEDGYLYVTSGVTGKVVRYDLTSGAYVDDFATTADGLDYSRSLTFHDGALYVTSINNDDVVRFAMRTEAAFSVTLSMPAQVPVSVDYATSDLAATAGSDYESISGTILFAPGQTTQNVVVPIIDDTTFETVETFRVNLSNASAGSIVDGVGLGTILDDDPAPPNASPTADNDAYSVAEDAVLNVAAPGVLVGDTDPENDPLTAALVAGPSHGVVTLNADGSFTYTPNGNYYGPDSFIYRAIDGTSDSNVASVAITVTAVNDPPVADSQIVNVKENTSKAIAISASDVEGDMLTYSIQTGPGFGTLSGTAPNLTYTPNTGFTGTDSFTFLANDGTDDSNLATVTVNVADNLPPVADSQAVSLDEDGSVGITLTGSDADGDPLTYTVVDSPIHGTLTGVAPNLTYTPDTNFHGSDSLTFRVNDGTDDSGLATVAIAVNPVNDAPVADPQAVVTDEDTPLAITLTGSDIEGDSLTYIIVDGPAHGSLTGTGPNRTYTPDTNFHGSDGFTFKVDDGVAQSQIVSVAITVDPVNDAPVAQADNYTASEDTPLSVAAPGVLQNDGDVDGDSLSAVAWSGATSQGGQVALNANGSFTYTPPAGFSGTDTFSHTVTDGSLESEPVTVSIEVAAATSNVLYVYDIRFESIWWGWYRQAVFEIRNDSNGDGQGTAADDAAAGVQITVEFAGQTYTGTTDANGIFRTGWIRNPGSGSYAEVVDLALANYAWNRLTLDLEDDSDGDGFPDAVL